METITTRELKEQLASLQGQSVTLRGWIRNHRKQKNMGFIDFFDGTCFRNPQVVYDNNIADFDAIQTLRVGSAVQVTGKVVPSYKDPETPEIQAETITLEGDCPEDYPLQPKRHTVEYLREIAYLRPRTRLFQAVFRVRSVAAMA
ncbi:MAG: asparagine--tRNA ligase, partial [Lachnospiraceae bacterium]|nr:asparagine--tRNA ligase [Lachnospiraceae bacterium]